MNKAKSLLKTTNAATRLLWVLVAILFLNLSGCQWLSRLVGRGPNSDLRRLEEVAKTKPGTKEALIASRKGAKTAFIESKDYNRALFFYKYLVLYSDDETERSEAQKVLAEIYFERLMDYDQAVLEYNRLLELPHTPKEDVQYRMAIAKSYFYLNKFSQAEAELDLALRKDPKGQALFDANLLKGNIFLATRNLDGAIDLFKSLMQSFPQQSKDEHVGLSLAVCYEEKNDFKRAKEILSDIRGFYPRPDFIDLKIQKLEEREAQLPGAQGLRK